MSLRSRSGLGPVRHPQLGAVHAVARDEQDRDVAGDKKLFGLELFGPYSDEPGQMSLTRRVPASVPSVTHSSEPVIPLFAANRPLPSPTAKTVFRLVLPLAVMSLTRWVPASVPSVTHSSVPVVPHSPERRSLRCQG